LHHAILFFAGDSSRLAEIPQTGLLPLELPMRPCGRVGFNPGATSRRTTNPKKYPRLVALHDCVVARPRIVAYLSSKRRRPFNQQDLFRHYQELDG